MVRKVATTGRKRDQSPLSTEGSRRTRSLSPHKRVNFPRGSNLHQGPSGTGDVDTRSRTPSRGVLHPRQTPEPPGISEGEVHEASSDVSNLDSVSTMSVSEMRNEVKGLLDGIRTDHRRPSLGENSYCEVLGQFLRLERELGVPDILGHGDPRQVDELQQLWMFLDRERQSFERSHRANSGSERGTPSQVSLTSSAKRSLFAGASDTHSLKKSRTASMFEESIETSLSEDDGEDIKICQRMAQLTGWIRDFAESFPPDSDTGQYLAWDFFDNLLEKENEHLIRYLGCLAIAGNQREQSWKTLLSDRDARPALVMGVIGRVLKDHVLADLLFGGGREEQEELSEIERRNVETSDGFSRTQERAKKVQQFAKNSDRSNFQFACAKLTMQLEKMLAPFWDGKETRLPIERRRQLRMIVGQAAHLSRDMRSAPDVIYYWPLTFKDEEFEPSRMECLNLRSMILTSPYEKREIGGFDRAVLKGNKDQSEAVVRIVCFPGLVAYRRQGGQLAQDELREERQRLMGSERDPPDVVAARRWVARGGLESYNGSEGFRSKVICKSVVYLAWGRKRLLTREAGTSAHIDAQKPGGSMQKYIDDYAGFEELLDIARRRWETA